MLDCQRPPPCTFRTSLLVRTFLNVARRQISGCQLDIPLLVHFLGSSSSLSFDLGVGVRVGVSSAVFYACGLQH
jgi:hypothetical protein